MAPPLHAGQHGTCSQDTNENLERLEFKPTVQPFAARVGGNQSLILDPNDESNAELLKRVPDAAPFISIKAAFSLRAFTDINLWKFSLVECVGSMMFIFITAWFSAHPPSSISPINPNNSEGIYATSAFLGSLAAGVTNWIFLTLLVYTFGSVSGAHLNPLITMASFFAQLISFPRMVLYIAGQTFGAALAGWMLRTAYGSRDFVVGGCDIDPALVPSDQALVIEFVCCLLLLFLVFGVGLDPRQSKLYGTALSPWLVGLSLGVVSWASGFTREGYSGASLNPARCFGVYVASHFPTYHWVHWIGPIAASIGHAIIYKIVPPWSADR